MNEIIQNCGDKSMQNKTRLAQIKSFLEKNCGLKKYKILSMGFDASSRKYFRILKDNGKTDVLVDDEGCKNHSKEFVIIAKFLLKNGIRAPKIRAKDLKKGLMLIEDFGESDFVKVADGKNDKELLRKAVDVLIKLHKVKEFPICAKKMDKQVILDNFALFSDWYIPACMGKNLDENKRQEFFYLVEKLMPEALKMPETLVLWDYHVNNVMYPKDSQNAAIIDFQDAMRGPGLYDLASLLEDERRNISQKTAEELKEYYFTEMKDLRRQDFEKAYAYMALLRHMRVLGRFTTLITVSGKPSYASYVPHGMEMLKRSLENPMFREIKKWMEENFAESNWGIPKNKNITKAFVLAAGKGTRMRHLTQTRAKPMIEVAGRRLMDYGFDLLKNAKINSVVVNVCYKKEGVKKHLSVLKDFDIKISEEKELLETGGGIKKALKYFGDEPFAVINADNILLDDGYKPILRQAMDVWDEKKYDILLVLCDIKNIYGDHPKHGDYKICGKTCLRNQVLVADKEFRYVYVGVAIIHPKVFAGIKEKKFSLRVLFDKAEKEGRLGFLLSDRKEFLVGTPEAVKETELLLKAVKK